MLSENKRKEESERGRKEIWVNKRNSSMLIALRTGWDVHETNKHFHVLWSEAAKKSFFGSRIWSGSTSKVSKRRQSKNH